MNTSELHNTQVNLTGLMEILSKHLYSVPTVAIRELVQNAHDSCSRRRLETDEPFEPSIRLSTQRSKGILLIEDSGAGLTKKEITQYITTIGSGYTRVLREKYANDDMIGCFGLGFLTAYAIAKRVELWTTSYQEPDIGWRFVSHGAERYHIEPAASRAIGMRIVLHLSRDFLDLTDPVILKRLLIRYCCLLPIPIYVNDDDTPVNTLVPPWRTPDDSLPRALVLKQCLEFAGHFESRFEPVCAIPISPTEECDVSGLLWIHNTSSYASSDNRNVSVFIRGMLVSSDERELLPAWAGFVGGVLESNALLPTASREGLQKDAAYSATQHTLKEQFIAGLSSVCRHEPSTWRQILRRHTEALFGAALCDERLFRLLADELKIPTSEGEMTIPAIRQRCGNKIYVSTGERGGYEEVIFRALMKPIVSGFRYAVFPFCTQYANMFGLKVIHLGTQVGDTYIFKREDIDRGKREKLQSLLAKPGQELIPTRFQPDYLPLVLIPDREHQLKQRIESDQADHRISTGALRLARMYTKRVDGGPAARLYVNLNSPIIQKLPQISDETGEHVGKLLQAFTHLLVSHHEPDFTNDLAGDFKTYSEAIVKLLEGDGNGSGNDVTNSQ